MKKILLFMAFLTVGLFAKAGDVETAQALAQRLFPNHAKYFVFEKINSNNDCFELESRGGKIVIRGNNANSMAVGLNHYLRYYCKTSVSWFVADEIYMPAKLPKIAQPVKIDARCKERFFLNYCTYGYTMPWWTWKDWEHFIDWMALNGINLPLAITGQEVIWQHVWKGLGLTDDEVRSYFTGPAHLPWHRMQNIDRWQGPLPQSWLDNQEALQKQIVARERELNMKPVLPAFSGHVPIDIKRIYPDVKLSPLGDWAGFDTINNCYFLDPMDPLYPKIQKAFLEEQTRLFGTDHIYGLDLFNEMIPPSWDLDYLSRVSRQVYETLKAVDSKAVWLQMTWLFYNERRYWFANDSSDRVKSYITAVPTEGSLLLDYYCERMEIWKMSDKYFGMPYIWCYLGNFGGNTNLIGNIDEVNKHIENTYANGGNNFRGIGSTLEGFDCNPFVYEFIFEKAWNIPMTNDIKKWIDNLADQRTHTVDANARAAWQLLVDSIYIKPTSPGQCSFINVRPTFGKFKSYNNTRINYDNKNLIHVLDLLLQAKAEGSAYNFDVVNITRQLMGNYFGVLYKKYYNAYVTDKDTVAMKQYKAEMLDVLDDCERLLETNSTFLLGKWINDARNMGKNDAEKLYYERNARNLLSTWGEKDNVLNDYASRTWAGLTSTYYAERWKMFFAAVEKAIKNKLYFTEIDYYKNVTNFEEKWWKDCIGKFSPTPTGNGVEIAKEMLNKYRNRIENN